MRRDLGYEGQNLQYLVKQQQDDESSERKGERDLE